MTNDLPSSLLDHYRAIEAKAHDMLQSAREARWDDVARVRADCRDLIAALEAAKATRALTPAEDHERLRILRRVVLCDGQTRQLSCAGTKTLDSLLAVRS
jgi:hypothetical protein